MPSPFPGMDPYLEGYLWPDLHHSLATEISRRLQPFLRPRYVARIQVDTVDDQVPAHELGIAFFPDVEVVRPPATPETPVSNLAAAAITPPTMSRSVKIPLQVRRSNVQIRDAAGNELVTSIELISPTNKRNPGLGLYRQKRARLQRAGVHLLEIDLIRRGTRPGADEDWPTSAYMMSLIRRNHAQAELWPLSVRDRLPVLPVPLRAPDPDVPLDLPTALATIYDEAYYAATLDYNAPPPEPPLGEDDAQWLDGVLRQSGWRK